MAGIQIFRAIHLTNYGVQNAMCSISQKQLDSLMSWAMTTTEVLILDPSMEEISTSQVQGRRFQGTPKQQQHQLKKKKKRMMGHLHQRRQPSSLTSRNNPRSNKSSKFEQRKEEGWCKEDEEISDDVERRIMALQKLVPGGKTTRSVDEEERSIDKLFEETADYILALQGQVNTLKFLTSFIEERNFDQNHDQMKEKRKLGG